MLGYRDINGDICTKEDAEKFISFMELNKELLDSTNSKIKQASYKLSGWFDLYEFYDIKHAFISDSIIISFEPKAVDIKNVELCYSHSANALFIIIMRIQSIIFHCFNSHNIFLRGGISTNYCFVKDQFIVGEGLINAYKAESSLAIYPRIACSPEIISDKKLMKHITRLSNLMYGGENIIKTDIDNVSYLDYIGYQLSSISLDSEVGRRDSKLNLSSYLEHVNMTRIFLSKHVIAINKKLAELDERLKKCTPSESPKVQKIKDKFVWLKNYHNKTVDKYSLFHEYKI